MHTPPKVIELMNSIADVGEGRTIEQIRADYFEEKKGPGHEVAGQELIRLRRADLTSIAKSLERIADVVDPPPSKIVDSPYVANRLDCTTVWVAEMARNGQIPKNCIVAGTGNGKVWKFYRTLIDQWIESR